MLSICWFILNEENDAKQHGKGKYSINEEVKREKSHNYIQSIAKYVASLESKMVCVCVGVAKAF